VEVPHTKVKLSAKPDQPVLLWMKLSPSVCQLKVKFLSETSAVVFLTKDQLNVKPDLRALLWTKLSQSVCQMKKVKFLSETSAVVSLTKDQLDVKPDLPVSLWTKPSPSVCPMKKVRRHNPHLLNLHLLNLHHHKEETALRNGHNVEVKDGPDRHAVSLEILVSFPTRGTLNVWPAETGETQVTAQLNGDNVVVKDGADLPAASPDLAANSPTRTTPSACRLFSNLRALIPFFTLNSYDVV